MMIDSDATTPQILAPRRRWQFSLRFALLGLLVLSVLFAVAARFPRQSAFAAAMTFLLVIPLAVVQLLRAPLAWWSRREAVENGRSNPVARVLLWPFRPLHVVTVEKAPSLAEGILTAAASTIAVVGLWPLLREIGLVLSIFTLSAMEFTWSDAVRNMTEAFSSGGYWLRLWRWELWAVGRWWLMFGVLALLWVAMVWPWRRRLTNDRASDTLARLLAFTPWLLVLEIGFLAGVWIESPNTVPEPSTGFVVGIFEWSLWHWDCWLDRGWIIRGALPTFVVAAVFFASVVRWPWPAALAAAIVLIPAGLTLSVACTVAYQNGFPPLF